MGKVIKKKIQGMNWLMKTGLVLLLTLTTMVFMYEGWYKPKPVQAAITAQQGWSQIYNSAALALSGTNYTANAGTNRLLVVAVTCNLSAAATQSTTLPSATFGGTALTLVPTHDAATSARNHAYLFYMKDASIGTGAKALNVTLTGGTVMNTTVYAAIFAGVDQTTTLNDSKNFVTSTDSASFTLATALNVAANNQAIYVSNVLDRNAVTIPTYTIDAAWTSALSQTGTNAGNAMGWKTEVSNFSTQPVSLTTNNATISTINPICRGSISAMSMNAAAATAGTLAVSTATQTVAEAVGNATISVTRTGGTTGAVTVDYATANGTALAGQDYTSTTGTLSWAAGDAAAKTITVPITNDTFDDLANETFTVTLSNATNGAALGTAVQTVTITDDDATPTVAFSAATSSGSRTVTPAVFTVNLSAVSGLATSVNYTTANGTAVAGTDYTTTSGTLNIPALSPSGTINVPINAASAGGTFTVTLSAPTNATLGTTTVHTFTITAVSSAITRCDGCHGYSVAIGAGATFADGTARNTPVGKFQGSHNAHVIGEVIVCSTCHVAPATEGSTDFGHSKGTITMQPAISGGTYSRVSPMTVSNTFTPGSCSGTSCHAQVYAAAAGTSGNWGTPGGGCGACHSTTPGTFTGTGSGPVTGGHNLHMAVSGTVCGDCHNGAVSGVTGGALHGNGFINVSTGYTSTNPSRNKVAKRAAGGTYYTCNNASCHASPYSAASATTGVWGTGTGGCVACHNASTSPFISYSASFGGNVANPLQSGPNTASHSGHMNYGRYNCAECHAGALTGSTGGNKHGNGFINVTGARGIYQPAGIAKHAIGTYSATGCADACHKGVGGTANAIWGSLVLRCIDCHAAQITRTKGRPGKILSAVKAEFGLAWGHKRNVGAPSARLPVTSADCIVCHLEGNYATQQTSKYHADGNIDLRDPDIQGETPITNIAGTAFTFQRFSTSYAAASRTNVAITETIANIISQKFCLKCHDSAGAANTTARAFGVVNSATMPWGGSTGYAAVNGVPVANGLVNVASQFALTNSSKHPLLGPLTKGFPTAARLNAPYNGQAGTRVNAGTTLTASVVMNCFDCHNSPTVLTTRTVAAHGNTVTLRGTPTVPNGASAPALGTNEATLCKVCHAAYNTSGATHGTGSAYSSTNANNGMSTTMQYGCNMCHSSAYDTPAVRPVRAMDVHGVNVLPAATVTLSGRWSTGTDKRPYAFIRNATFLGDHTPLKIGATTYSPGCDMAGGSGAAGQCNGQGPDTYTAGGTY